MTSIFNFFKSGGAYSKATTTTPLTKTDEKETTTIGSSSTTPVSSSDTSSPSTNSGSSSSDTSSPSVTPATTKEQTPSNTTTTYVEGKNMILSLQLEEKPHFNDNDLKELLKLKEHLQYKPSVLNLVAVYQAEIKKHIEFGITKPKKKILNYQIEPAPTHHKYVFLTSSGLPGVYCTNNDLIDYGHYEAIREGKSIMHSFDLDELPKIEEKLKNQTKISSNSSIANKKKELEQLEQEYVKLIQEKEKLIVDRAAVLSPEELAIIEEEEGTNQKQTEDGDEWEIERKRRIIENEKKLIEKRLTEAKKHKNIRFYCKKELEYLQKWNEHFIATKDDTTAPSGVKDMLRYPLKPTNMFDLDAEEIHYRFCESQFHRLAASPMYGSSYPTARIESVEYVVNPVIMRRFNLCKQELAKKHGFLLESMKPLLLFHGTSDTNMENILKTNFLLNKIGSTTDMGWYGKGFYFSEYPGLSMGYARNQFLLICMVLIGKAFHMNQVETGRAIEPGYDSHVSPDGCSEVIIFNPDQIIPLYKIQWAQN